MLAVGLGVPAGLANVIAVVCGIGPSYRRQPPLGVATRTAAATVAREVVPFWTLSLAGLALSTVAVACVGAVSQRGRPRRARSRCRSPTLAVFGALWLVQFVILDRVIFRDVTVEGVQS